MTIAHDARRVVEESIDAAIEIVGNKLMALKTKNEKEQNETTERIIKVTQLVLDARLSLERMMLVDEKDAKDEDPDLFGGRETRT